MRTALRFWLGLTGVALLAACGGGGGGGSDASQPVTQDPPPTTLPAGTASIGGIITASERQYIDSDTNDPFSSASDNNSPAQAQPVANPSTVGGFATQAPTGVNGDRFAQTPDPADFYAVDLVTGQSVVLDITDDADLDLYLVDGSGNRVDGSVNAGSATDQIVLSGPSGRYFVEVSAFAGTSNYLLRIGETEIGSAASPAPWEQRFVAGEAIVSFANSAAAQAPANSKMSSLSVSAVMQDKAVVAGAPGAERLMRFETADRAPASVDPDSPLHFVARQFGQHRAAFDTWLQIKRMALDPAIKAVQPNYRVNASRVPNDTLFPRQWHYRNIGLPQAWDTTTGSAQTVIAIVDSGVEITHPDLSGKLTNTGYDFVRSTADSGDGDGIDPNPDDPGMPGGSRSVYHGTHVAGTAAGQTNNGTGTAGVAWNASIMAVRVLGVNGGGSSFDVLQGVRYAAGLPNDSGILLPVSQRADVINLSLGGGGACAGTPEASVYEQVRARGIIVVAAAGNEASSQPNSPASCPGVISVSATRLDNTLAPYSNFGSSIDIAAPGGDGQRDQDNDQFPDGVLSTSFDDTRNQAIYRYLNGTSMASPHVAGVAALMRAIDPDLSPEEFENLLISGRLTRDIGQPGRDNLYGFGLIDAPLAVASAAAGAQPFLRADPARLDFSFSGNRSVSLTEPTGEGSVGNVTVSDNASAGGVDWLDVTATSVDADGLGTYTASVDTSGLPDEAVTYNATINFSADSGLNTQVPVSLRIVGPTDLSSNAGLQFVLLVDPDTQDTLAQRAVSVSNGSYGYLFSDVPAGSYLVVSGSDSDNDGLICDPGESCGGFPTVAETAPFTVAEDEDRRQLNFGTGFDLSSAASIGNQSSGQSEGQTGFRLLNKRAPPAKQLPDRQ